MTDYTPYDIVVPKEPQAPKFKRIPPAGMHEMKTAVMEEDLAYMKHRVLELDMDTRNRLTVEEFEPIRKLVYGLIATILVAIIGALMSLTVSG